MRNAFQKGTADAKVLMIGKGTGDIKPIIDQGSDDILKTGANKGTDTIGAGHKF